MASGPRRKLPAQRLATFPRRPRVSSARYLRCSPSPPSSSAPAPRRYFPALADRLFVDRSRQPKQYLLGRSRQMSLKIISDSVWWEKHSSGAQSPPPPPPHWYSNQRTQRQSCCCCCCCCCALLSRTRYIALRTVVWRASCQRHCPVSMWQTGGGVTLLPRSRRVRSAPLCCVVGANAAATYYASFNHQLPSVSTLYLYNRQIWAYASVVLFKYLNWTRVCNLSCR